MIGTYSATEARMVRMLVRIKFLAETLLAVLLVVSFAGCVSSDAAVAADDEQLDQWLADSADQDQQVDSSAIPERDATPPRRVSLDSIETADAGADVITGLPKPAYFSFELAEPGYVSISVGSDAGAAITLIDRSIGVMAQSGSAGVADGRIDLLLDAGEYRVRTQTVHDGDRAEVQVNRFTDVELNTELLLDSPPGTLHTSTLNDYEQRSYWIEVTDDDPFVLEAMGRALRSVRIWKDGVWVIDTTPNVSTYSPVVGQSMGYVQAHYSLPVGNYLVTFYGGAPRAWEEETGERPFYIRRGGQFLGSIVDMETTVSPMGRDAYLITGDITVMEIENSDFVPVRLGISSYGSGRDRFSASSSTQIRESDESTRSRASISRTSAEYRWLFVDGVPGDMVRVRALPRRTEYRIDDPPAGAQYLVSTISTFDADHSIDATPFVERSATRTVPEEVTRAEALVVTDSEPLFREINLTTAIYYLVDLNRSGRWALVHDQGEDAPIAVSIIPLRELNTIRNPQIITENPASFDLESGLHLVMLRPSRPNIVRFVLYYQGVIAAVTDRRAEGLLSGDAPAPRRDVTYITERNEIRSGIDHTITLNDRGEPTSALFVERLPVTLEEPVPLTLEPRQEFSLPVSTTASGALSTGNSAIQVERSGTRIREGGTLPRGRATLTITNTSNDPQTIVLRLVPQFVARFSAPDIPILEDTYPILRAGESVYADYEPDQVREYLLVVDEPSFYELQTTGRLNSRISVRTQVNPQGQSAQSNGPGRNALVQGYFRPGTFLVTVQTQRPSAGRAGLVMMPLALEDLGVLTEGATYRTELDASTGLLASAAIREAGSYAFSTIGLYGGLTTRLEDEDAWPVDQSGLSPGLYRYYSWPQTVWNRRLTSYVQMIPATSYTEDEPWPLPLNSSFRRTWNETPGRAPHEFTIHLPAQLQVSVSVSSQMEWWITDPNGSRVTDGSGSQSVEMPAGIYTISVRSREENNNVGYSISVSTGILADGVPQSLSQSSATMTVAIGEPGVYEFWSTGTWDIRASLQTNDGEYVLAEGDDRPGDWNFHISRFLPEGTYRLALSEVFSGSRSSVIWCQRRDEAWIDTQSIPFESRITLDRTIIGVPFTTDAGVSPMEITTDASAANLALYRGDRLVAEGKNALYVPLLGNEEYVLRLRNDSLNAVGATVSIRAAEMDRLRWDGDAPVEIPPGAVEISNRSSISALATDPAGSLRVSSGVEQAARIPGSSVVADSSGVMWCWNTGDEPVSIRPFDTLPGQARALDITNDDVSTRIAISEGNIYVVEARTMAGYLGLESADFSALSATRNWSAADMAQSSTILGIDGGNGETQRQIRTWDGEPQSGGRRVELVANEYSIAREIPFDGDEVIALAPMEAVSISANDTDLVELLLSPDVIAFTSEGSDTLSTVAARETNLSEVLPAGDALFLVNTGRQERTARVQTSAVEVDLQVTATLTAETLLASAGTVTVRVAPGSANGSVRVWAVNPSDIVLLTDSGRRLSARPPGTGQPFWLLPGVPGELQVSAEAGPVVAWLETETRDVVEWAQTGAGRSVTLTPGENTMADGPQRWEFSLPREQFVLLTTSNRGVTMLVPGGEQSDLAPQVAVGEGETRRVLAVLGEGTHRALTRPMAGEPQPGTLRFQALDPIPISETIDTQPLFLGAGERAVFELTVVGGSAVGVGLRAENDDFSTYLLDSQLGVVGTGRIYYRELEPGRYFFLVENGDRPMNAEPVIYADQGSRTGVPEDVIESYRGN